MKRVVFFTWFCMQNVCFYACMCVFEYKPKFHLPMHVHVCMCMFVLALVFFVDVVGFRFQTIPIWTHFVRSTFSFQKTSCFILCRCDRGFVSLLKRFYGSSSRF